jgi:hypothetical protein
MMLLVIRQREEGSYTHKRPRMVVGETSDSGSRDSGNRDIWMLV